MVHQEIISTLDRVRAILSNSTAQLFIRMSQKKINSYLVVVLPKLGFKRIISCFALTHFIIKAETKRNS